ncbi:MAG TPA: ion channel [Croceibacterium sp.]
MNPLDHTVDPHLISATFNEQLAVGAVMIAICVIIHGTGLFTLRRLMHSERSRERIERMEPLSIHGALFTLFVVFALIFIHFIEIWLFALLYDLVGALRTFEQALYISTISYATIGFSDVTIAHQWRQVAATEGLLGIILLGWSTAFFVRVLDRLERDPPPR